MKIINNKLPNFIYKDTVYEYIVYWFEEFWATMGVKYKIFALKKDAVEFCKKKRQEEKDKFGQNISFVVRDYTSRDTFRKDIKVEYIKRSKIKDLSHENP